MEAINTKRFRLREVEESDVSDIYEILSDDDVIKNLNMDKPKNIEDVKGIVRDYLKEMEIGNKYPFAIIDKESRRFHWSILN